MEFSAQKLTSFSQNYTRASICTTNYYLSSAITRKENTMTTVNKTDQASFENDVLNSDKPVLVDFWAEWCGPCRTLGPVLEEVAGEVGENASIFKVNVDENGELAQKYGIRGIPTMIFFKSGEAAKTLVGVQPKEEIKKTLEELA